MSQAVGAGGALRRRALVAPLLVATLLGAPAPRQGALAASAPSCADYSFPVYFRRGSATLAPGAETAIAAALRHFRRCPIAAVTVVGLSTPKGGDILMENRLKAVARELRARGLKRPAPSIAGAVVAHRRPLVADQAMVSITMAR